MKPRTKIIIEQRSGKLLTVFSDNKDIDILICDYDKPHNTEIFLNTAFKGVHNNETKLKQYYSIYEGIKQ